MATLITTAVNGNLTVTGTVGIGTTAPYGRLELNGSGQSWITAPAIRMWDSFNSKGWLVGNVNNITPGDFYIRTLPSVDGSPGTNQQEFTIKHATGNVGIGTTSPAKKLHVYNDGPNQGLRASNLDGVNMDVLSGANGGIIGTYSNHPLSLYTNSTEKVTITTGGNFGINTTSPSYRLDVVGSARINGGGSDIAGFFKSSTSGTLISFEDTVNQANDSVSVGSAGNSFVIKTNYSERIRVTSSGDMGIGTNSPGYKLDVSGTIRATGDVIAYSDARVKENIETISNALDKVNSIRGVNYNKIGDNKRSIGVIAQEVLEVLPEVIHQDETGMYSVAYGNIVGVLIEAVKELTTRVEELEAKLK